MPLQILLLTHRIPYPLNDGGAMGVHYFMEGYLQQGIALSVLSMNTTKHFVPENKWPALYKKLQLFKAIPIDNAVKLGGAFKNLFSTKSYNTQRFESKEFENALIEILQANTYDVVQIDNIYLESYIHIIKKFSKAKITCRIHNIEHLIWQTLADNKPKSIKKWYLNLLAKRLKKVELHALQNVDVLLTINKKEEQILKDLGIQTKCFYMPFGLAFNNMPLQNVTKEPLTIFHIGSMDWQPNQEAVEWFLQEVWPIVEAKNGAIQLHLGGKHMPKYLLESKLHNVIVHANVPDAIAFMQKYHTLIVPLKSGAGIRIKILEALGLGKHIVSTSMGANGIDITNKKNILLADNVQEFAEAIIQIMDGKHANLGNEAKQLAMQNYNKDILFSNLQQYLLSLAKA